MGNEGKGKATDLLGNRIDCVVKFNGGNNAGHTVIFGDQKLALHVVPIGILTDYVITKLGVLTCLLTIPECVAYDVDGKRVDEVPVSPCDFHHAKPVYERFAGWSEDITGVREFGDLPENAQKYVLAVEAMSGCRISAIGVGPGRDAIIARHDLVA